jgi:poly(A) polymerase
VRVVKTLQEAGYQAYVVGGAVRDLLVGMRPKDFDVATDATPEQVKALFRRAFIIGRRFRLVHVVFGRGREHEVIEVSTFRAYLDPAAADQVPGNEKPSRTEMADKKHVVDASGRVLRDNVWGPQIEDAARRDFTINAMYYDPLTQTVVDYHGGLADVRAAAAHDRRPRDPLPRRPGAHHPRRALRGQAGLCAGAGHRANAPMRAMTALLANVPISRLFDEMVKLLQTGHALASIEQLRRYGLVGTGQGVFPVLEAALAPTPPNPQRENFVRLALQDTDTRVAEGRPWRPATCWPACCGTTCRNAGAACAKAARRRSRAATGGRRGVRRPHRRHLGPRQAGRRHARDLAHAAPLRAANGGVGPVAGGAATLSRRL